MTKNIAQDNISVYRGITPDVLTVVEWQTAVEAIKTDKYRDAIEALRSIKDPEEYRKEKTKLISLTFGGTFNGRRAMDAVKAPTGFIVADIDHIPDVAETFEALKNDEHIWFAFISPGCDGIKVGLRSETVTCDAEHKQFYRAVEKYFKDVYGIKIDPACKDISRLTFVSWDPGAYINENACYFDHSEFEMPTEPETPPKPITIDTNPRKQKSGEKVLASACLKIRESQPGEQHDARLKQSILIGGIIPTGYLDRDTALKELESAVAASGAEDMRAAMKDITDGIAYGEKRPIDKRAELDEERAEATTSDKKYRWSDLGNIDLLDELREALNRNEQGDALLIKRRFHGRLVYDHNEGVWYRFKGHHWHRDNINKVREIVVSISDLHTKGAIQCLELQKKLIEFAGPQLDDKQKTRSDMLSSLRDKSLKRAKVLLSESRAKKVLNWAAAGKPLGVTSEVWEADPWLLGVKNGVVDLKTGKLRSGKPEDHIRTFTPIEYDPHADCPTWQRFLLSVFYQPNDNDTLQLLDYFQKLLGYTLIGTCIEAIFAILFGSGRNGKTTLLEIIRHVLGPYSYKANSELFLKQTRPGGLGNPDSETLALRHKRFVYCAETEEGRLLDGNRVKHLSGNDCLTARGLYEKRPTEFLPTHTLYLMTNDKPQIRSDDFAIWQRIKPVPFLVSFVDEPQGAWQKPADKDMQNKLKAEAEGILTWIVEGCLLYQKEGLETPSVVIEEAQEYRSAESLLQQWAQDFCLFKPDAESQSKALFDSFCKWLDDNGHKKWTHKTFSNRMLKEFGEYGVEKNKTRTGAIFTHIELRV